MISESRLTESDIRANANARSFARGEEYFEAGAVASLVRRGDALHAEVEGSGYEPYRVAVAFDGDANEASCTCPYMEEWDGWCKHIVAALLAYLNEPDAVEQQPSPRELLAPLGREQLLELMVRLAERDPNLADDIAAQVALVAASPGTASSENDVPPTTGLGTNPMPAMNAASLRRQVRGALHSLDRLSGSEAYWHVGGAVDKVLRVTQPARDFLAAGDGRGALAVLQAVTEEYLRGWEFLDDSNGEVSGFFDDLGPLWSEAVLSADLTPAERESWAERLDDWQQEIADYGVDDAFEPAAQAARQGWDYEPLVRVLEGRRKGRAWKGEVPEWADDLARARLNVLERQERFEEYLRLALAEEQHTQYAVMLARRGRTDEAVAHGLKRLGVAQEILTLARALHEAGAVEEALRVAEHGLSLEGGRAELAAWLRDAAAAAGRDALALRAAIAACRYAPDLKTYLRAKELAGDEWPVVREDALEAVRGFKGYDKSGPVEIFLHEHLFDDALAAVRGETYDYELVGRVVDAALQHRPQEVVPICRKHAEAIMDNKESALYDQAVRWLGRAKAAHAAQGRPDLWQKYRDELLAKHSKKYKLVPMLKTLAD